MRPYLTALLLAALLSACASKREAPPSKHIDQTGALKVHPDLVAPAAAPKPAASQ